MTADVGYLAHLSDELDDWIKNLRNKIKKSKDHKYHYHPDIKLGKAKFKFNIYRQNKDPKGNKVKAEKDIIKGRTTYWVPKIQK